MLTSAAHKTYVGRDKNGDAIFFHVELRDKQLQKQEQIEVVHLRCLIVTCRRYSEELAADEWVIIPTDSSSKSLRKVYCFPECHLSFLF